MRLMPLRRILNLGQVWSVLSFCEVPIQLVDAPREEIFLPYLIS